VDSSLLRLDYGYATTTNNGNLQSQSIAMGATTISQSYVYDRVNRLTTATESGSWSQSHSYDQFGNRWVSSSTGYTLNPLTPQSQSAFNAATNRLTASLYDTSGNQIQDSSGRTFGYDAENRQTSFNGGAATYSYDGEGHRIKKVDTSGTTVYVYNAGGQLIAEYTSGAATGSGTSYVTTDTLGSTRLVTKGDGTVKARYDYLPFGEEVGAGVGQRTIALGYGATDNTTKKFTAKERDSESGLDYFLARYYSSAQGRFTSPDEFRGGPDEFWVLGSGDKEKQALPYADIRNPQSLNKYHYSLNNPLRYVDPDGHQAEEVLAWGVEFLAAGAAAITIEGVAAGAAVVVVSAAAAYLYIEIIRNLPPSNETNTSANRSENRRWFERASENSSRSIPINGNGPPIHLTEQQETLKKAASLVANALAHIGYIQNGKPDCPPGSQCHKDNIEHWRTEIRARIEKLQKYLKRLKGKAKKNLEKTIEQLSNDAGLQ
jgi:RHS repeat-associated protein